MSRRVVDALRRVPVLARPRRRRVRKSRVRPAGPPRDPQPRPARAPYILRASSRRIPRLTMPEAIVPYLRLSGRWLEEHGFVIGTTVQVLVERGRVTLISEGVEETCKVRRDDGRPTVPDGDILLLTHEHLDAQVIHGAQRSTSRRGSE